MQSQTSINDARLLPELNFLNANEIISSVASTKTEKLESLLQNVQLKKLGDLLIKLATPAGKKSFLVFKNSKYINVPTKNIALFYIKHASSVIVCFDKQEYFVNYSLEQIQNLLPENEFFRLNRQYLINFNAVKEVEHYFSRKLLVSPVIAMKEKLLVSKEKVSEFLHWLDNR